MWRAPTTRNRTTDKVVVERVRAPQVEISVKKARSLEKAVLMAVERRYLFRNVLFRNVPATWRGRSLGEHQNGDRG
jgi:hypothetical protein